MEIKHKLPAIIWLPQILLILFSLLFAYSCLGNIWMFANYLRGNESNAEEFRHILLGYSFILIVFFVPLLILLSSIFGILRRKRWARWSALFSLVIVWLLLIAELLFRPINSLPYYRFQNDGELITGVIIQIVIHSLFLYSIVILIFSKKIIAFFNNDVLEIS